MEYRVSLENFAGPLDLLLFLVKKEELDIHDIPIARVLDQYLEYLKLIDDLDLDDAGEFLVLATTLMVIKSRMLLPAEQVDFEQEIDPRFELVHQLIEYKKIKDRSSALESRAGSFSQMVGRPETARVEGPVEKDKSMDEVGIFDLLQAFGKLMEATGGATAKVRTIKVDDTPVRIFAQRLGERLKGAGSMLFSELFAGPAPRQEKIGWFLALLLLLKQQMVDCSQDGYHGDIRITFRGDAASPADMAGAADAADDFRP